MKGGNYITETIFLIFMNYQPHSDPCNVWPHLLLE